MNFFRSRYSLTGVPAVAAATAAAVVGLACAPATALAAGDTAVASPPAAYVGNFDLNTVAPSAVVSNGRVHEVEICNQTGTVSPEDFSGPGLPPFTPAGAVTLKVRHDGQIQRIAPGECDRMAARHLRITTDEPLEPGSQLQGTVAWAGPAPAGTVIVSGPPNRDLE
ncbi:MAG TPA: hypothetical protein VMU40_01055 [Steroidobacteraceae bacterium]|nr:hypothetical protein [Steroidobacteraceae bacterium]